MYWFGLGWPQCNAGSLAHWIWIETNEWTTKAKIIIIIYNGLDQVRPTDSKVNIKIKNT